MAKYEKKRSARRSTSRHPITMASTAEPPNPIPCALASILLPESRARPPAICGKPCFRGRPPYMQRCAFLGRACTRGAIMRRASTTGAGATTWVRGVCAWRRGWAASVGGVLLAAGRACGNGVRVGMSGAGRRGAFRRCRFECVWTLGLVRGPMALSGLLFRPPSRALGCYCVERGWVPKMFLTMRTLRMTRS